MDVSPRPDRTSALHRAEALIATIRDYPEPGIVFRDLTPLFADAEALHDVIDALIAPFAGTFDAVAGIEARGFVLAGAASRAAGVGLVPIRKAGRLPRERVSADYALEYGAATIEAHRGDLPEGSRVLLLDDVLATGGTLRAAHEIGTALCWDVVGTAVVLEIEGLGGRDTVGADLHAVFAA
ncbi:MAG TPA: adenine phosphoribosyltransferase [Microbacterium sp.]|uniref:adenine phosphoribosyltransferase n=1 Tax=Microbacterium sp. TaxID=51671 RepID=UPI002CCD8B31|nr:adenine phosphoribosyltransferase [Microbacterium sp.]HWI30930.1 adenine phosphoribosyltransferase [Microbacterium sp.]